MERPQDMIRTLTEGAAWTTWLLQTAESLEKVKSPDYFNNVYKTLHPDDEIIVRVRNKEENYRLHLLIQEIDPSIAKVYTVTIHEIDVSTGEDLYMVAEKSEEDKD